MSLQFVPTAVLTVIGLIATLLTLVLGMPWYITASFGATAIICGSFTLRSLNSEANTQ
jgi:hypothetical protein